MASPDTTRIAHWLLDGITNTVTTYANDKSSLMMEIFGPVAGACFVGYILLWIAALAAGQVSEPFTEFMKRSIRIIIISGIAMSAGTYQNMVADLFLQAPSQIASQLMTSDSGGTADSSALAGLLDNSLQQGLDVGNKAWDKGDEMAQQGIKSAIAGLGYYGLALLVYLASTAIVAIAAAILFVAFVGTAILLALGPLFILFATFPQTYRYFEAWLGQLINFAFLYIIVAITVGLCFALFDQFLSNLPISTFNEMVVNAIKVTGAVIALTAVLLQTRSIASSLAGGASLQTQGIANKIFSHTTSTTRATVTGHSRRGIASRVNAGTATRATVRGASAGLTLPDASFVHRIRSHRSSQRRSRIAGHAQAKVLHLHSPDRSR